jgi:2-C-methyl-D-erythritol 2,4-cyclodiphosphate synthase
VTTFRAGNGFDVHAFVGEGGLGGDTDPQRRLVLGGVTFPDERALAGHSDADVIAHACAEALLGAAGLGDLGSHFPDTDERWAGADSLTLLAEVVVMLGRAGWRPVNVDCSVVAERPKLAPVREEMQANLSRVVGAPVTVKGRRAESLGALGRAEGIACWATALIEADDRGAS